MASQKTILLSFLLFGLVLAGKRPPTCPKNEIWLSCGTCETTCENPVRPCTLECKKPGCYCPSSKGFVRDANGHCIHLSECKHECGLNEEWRQCATCERTCQNPNPICTMECKPARCMCKQGYVRDSSGTCIPEKDCGQQGKCGEHEHYAVGECLAPCERSCRTLHDDHLICPAVCVLSWCYCDEGYVRNDSGQCIPIQDCPATNPIKS
ncbi:hypothetical protein QR680_006221 [Steinernema hermaphroditum]|uniref:TIL domain-containing protein n=1 Tax=Steinernema hermaphroditum TaxID=289476 RepID=A0AA39HUU5_9BILA|nr:hypothetical protein QR680_006221 [Steinernema hermaphroditum]